MGSTTLLYETLLGQAPRLPAQLSLSTGVGENDGPASQPIATAVTNPKALVAIAGQYR